MALAVLVCRFGPFGVDRTPLIQVSCLNDLISSVKDLASDREA
jgi:hypothetical protein